MLIESQSSDPYVRQLARNAMRVLNDPTLARWQRERQIVRLQTLLKEHYAKEQSKAARLAAKQERKAGQPANPGSGGSVAIAHASQLVARRRELGSTPSMRLSVEGATEKPTKVLKKVRLTPRPNPLTPMPVAAPAVSAANDGGDKQAKRA
jgi:hypothetical protein